MKMGDRIKEKRMVAGLTQEELAERIGVQKSAIAKYESGRVENIKRSKIQLLADILGTTPAYLMGWEEEPDTSSTTITNEEKMLKLKKETTDAEDEVMALREELRRRPEMKLLFSASKKATKKDILFVADMLKKLKDEYYDE